MVLSWERAARAVRRPDIYQGASALNSDAESEGEEAAEEVRHFTESEADITDGRLEVREAPARAVGNWIMWGCPTRWGVAQSINQLGKIGVQLRRMHIWIQPSELSEEAENVFCTGE